MQASYGMQSASSAQLLFASTCEALITGSRKTATVDGLIMMIALLTHFAELHSFKGHSQKRTLDVEARAALK
jgi:hypothetical protein